MELLTNIVDIISEKITVDTKIIIKGWVRCKRHSKNNISFIDVYDGSCPQDMQIIVKKKDIHNYDHEILLITTGCSISITGKLSLSLKKKQKYEVYAKKIKILGWVKNPGTYPISTKQHTLEYLREVAHLRARTKIISSIMRLKHNIIMYIQHFLHKKNFFWIHTPIITTLDTEGCSKMFNITTLNNNMIQNNTHDTINKYHFFNKKSFLTVSGQLHLETYACAMSKVYTFGPTFRAENSNTTRHLAEFWMLEIEIAFATLFDIIHFVKKMLQYVCKKLLRNNLDEINFLSSKTKQNLLEKINKIQLKKYYTIEYTKAIDILQESKISGLNAISWGEDLSIEHEKYLTNQYFNNPVIIYNYPKHIKAFYMYLNTDNKTVASMDILFPGIGEIIGGSQREHRINILDQRLSEKNLDKTNYWWYRDIRKYGTVQHSGCGIGFERLVSYLTGIKNIKDIIPYARTPHNALF
ncbi:asparagine--tRNA ligase [Enterobacteriaceae endosymbiont of Macroplea appendiculata]|uniref:asparagine--tRNA ligase n=1 Tax=Enterobacteriaceae endosymbiont of Macroplea appendiculata TaxID=2675790 RepID=UPI001448E944|nr:asparagine--tRNA ligase [Enterobacteriaceae endosymbiont of Macroplea appendiculata]QJC30895.1 asparagine--tRNA ligase [Enterobacteriaceae endosymbiont of Macroplea appendiculata]